MKPLTPEQSQLLAENQGLIWSVAGKLQNRGLDFEDLVSEGQFGLIHACQHFDPSRNLQFSTYATTCIRGQILSAIADKSHLIRVPSHLQTKANRGKFTYCQPLAEGDFGTPLSEITVTNVSTDPLVESEQTERIEAILSSLKPREAKILRLRFGLGSEQLTLDEVGSQVGLGKERVRQVQNAALRQIRRQMGACA